MLSYVYETTPDRYLLLNHKIWPLFTFGKHTKKMPVWEFNFDVKNGLTNVTVGLQKIYVTIFFLNLWSFSQSMLIMLMKQIKARVFFLRYQLPFEPLWNQLIEVFQVYAVKFPDSCSRHRAIFKCKHIYSRRTLTISLNCILCHGVWACLKPPKHNLVP